VYPKNGKKMVWKNAKTRFFKNTNIVTKNRRKKMREKNFQKTQIGYQKNVGKKLIQKSAQKFFLINT